MLARDGVGRLESDEDIQDISVKLDELVSELGSRVEAKRPSKDNLKIDFKGTEDQWEVKAVRERVDRKLDVEIEGPPKTTCLANFYAESGELILSDIKDADSLGRVTFTI